MATVKEVTDLRARIEVVILTETNLKKLFSALTDQRDRLEGWTPEQVTAATRRMKLELEETEAKRAELEAELLEALAELESAKCIRCGIMPVDDGIPICTECAFECGGDAYGVVLRNRRR